MAYLGRREDWFDCYKNSIKQPVRQEYFQLIYLELFSDDILL